MQRRTDLSSYSNKWYSPQRGALTRIIWHIANAVFLRSFLPGSAFKVSLLKLFGAKIGSGVVIKPHVSVKYPWLLEVGDHVWIGEEVWIDNLAKVQIGSNSCLSQGSMLLTGNHDYSSTTFDLMVKTITLEEGCWIGARAVVCPGVTCKSHSVLAVGSIAVRDLEEYSIYQGNPAVKVKDRVIG